MSLDETAGSASRPLAGGPADSTQASRPFVGRERETEQMARALDEALAGRGRFFLLMGEPGIGKTRLCDEISGKATGRGVPVLWGRAWEAGGAPAYWPWMEVLAGLARPIDDASLAAALGDGAALLGDLVPEIGGRLPAAAGAAAVPPPPDEARFRVWRTAVSLARRAAEPAGLVMVFDDLHSTDRASLLLLYALARELRGLRVLLLATCRDVEARLDAETGELISRLSREATVLGLSRLDRPTVDELVRRRAGDVAPEIQRRLFERTQGNPLFVEEMVRLLNEEGDGAVTAGVVPTGVRDVIRQRLDRVAADARGLLDLAAVAGDEVLPPLLAVASGQAPAWIAAQLAQALRAGVFAERAGRPRFSHALVREELYRGMTDEARMTLHATVGRALERLARPDAMPLMELAHHAVAGPPADLPRAVDFAVKAARRAMDLTAPEEAVKVLERVLAAVEAAGDPAALRAPVLLALGETRIRGGEVEAGKSLCCQAATLARSLDDAALLAEAALTYGRVFTFAVVDPVMVQLLEDALEAQPSGDSTTRARLLARLAGALQPATNPEEPVSLAREAIATARRLGDRRALLETIHDGLSALMDIVEPCERRDLNLEVERLATDQGDRERLMRTHARLALDHLSLGEFAEADARIDAFEQTAKELRASWMLWRVPLFRAVRAATHGRFEEAEELGAEAKRLAAGVPDPQAERALILHREGLLRSAERHQEMRALDAATRRARSGFQNAVAFQGVSSALVYTRVEHADLARMHLESVPEGLRPPLNNLFALFFIAEPAAYVGSVELAEKLYGLLAPSADQYVMLGMTQFQWEGPVCRILALLAARLGRWEQAGAHFDDAIARLRRLEARPHLARTLYEFGRALLERGRPADFDRAHAAIEEGRRLAHEMGMVGLVRLADARLPPDAQPPPTRDAAAGDPAAPVVLVPRPPPVPKGTLLGFTLEGEYWALTAADGKVLRLKDSLGMQYLARLLAEPGREIHVLELVGGDRVTTPGGAAIDTGDAGELLDEEARQDYRRRLEDLREALAEAESFGDQARATRAREEIDFLAAELGRAVGLGGRARRAGSAAERARSAVQRRIKNALVRIGEGAPELGSFLSRTIKTGNFCVYRPGD